MLDGCDGDAKRWRGKTVVVTRDVVVRGNVKVEVWWLCLRTAEVGGDVAVVIWKGDGVRRVCDGGEEEKMKLRWL